MKTIGSLLLAAGLFVLPELLHAQTAFIGGFNSDIAPVQPAPPDSIVQITAEAEGLSQVDPTTLPFFASCWWTVYPGGGPVPMPCPPQDLSVPVYQIVDGIYLVDETGGAVSVSVARTSGMQAATTAAVTAAVESQGNAIANLIEQVQTTTANQQSLTMARAMGMGVPSPGGGSYSPDGITNSYVAPDYGTNLWIAQTAVAAGYLNGIGTNTIADVKYEIQSRTNLVQMDWQSEGFIWGSELTNWTPLSVAQIGRTNLFIRLKSWADDGSGLPIWWQLQYFGTTGVNPNGDPMGDGYSNIQKFQDGMNPNVFYTPPTPQNVVATYNRNTGTETVGWSPSPGAVTSYTLTIQNVDSAQTTYLTLSPTNTSFTTNMAAGTPYYGNAFYGPQINVILGIKANYGTNGSSPASSQYAEGDTAPSAELVYGADGRLNCAFQGLPSDVGAVRIYRQNSSSELLDYANVNGPYAEDDLFDDIAGSPIADGYFVIPSTSITNGVCELPDSQVPPYFAYNLWVQTVRSNGVASAWTTLNRIDYGDYSASRPFIDARRQLKDNLIFLLRAADQNLSFAFTVNETGEDWYLPPVFTWPNGYVYSDFYNYVDLFAVDELMPLHQNYFYRNFLFDPNKLAADGFLNTGIDGASYNEYGYNEYGYNVTITNFPAYYFNAAAFIVATNPPVPPSQLTAGLSRWILPGDAAVSFWDGSTFASGQQNYYGLPWVSEEIAWVTDAQTVVGTFYPNDTFPNGVGGVAYNEIAQPEFQLAGYVFARPDTDPMPEENDFAPTGPQPTMLVGLGNSLTVAGFAELALANGNSGVAAYLGQYFSGAYQIDSNGVVTANSAGILSPYGAFSPTVPGPAALVTMPDIDPPYQQGTCTVYAVSIVLDRNQGSNMDLTLTGTDATSQANPLTIWANNDFDRGHLVDGSDFEQDDLGPVDIAQLPAYQQVPDCNYVNASGQPAIPSTRDLEDYFRLWLPGVGAAMKAMPSNYTVKLTLTGDGQIRIFHAIESNGGTNYLFDETTASNQVASSASLYVGLLTSSSSIPLPVQTNFNEHFIICGAHTGSAQVDLQILDGNGNTVADTTTYLQINDIKNMYERWTVGDTPSIAPKTAPVLAGNDMPVPAQPRFQYTPPQDTTTPYILFVHGWNMQTWEKDRYAEAAYKRLYWQGYHGRFGIFQWPTGNGFSGIISAITDARNYDSSEFTAWRSAVGLTNLLTQLDAEYPGHVYLMAHSMGNVVAGEAMRLAGSSQLANTYVAMQGAVPAHCYDASTVNRTTFSVPDRYAHYSTDSSPSYFNGTAGAGSYVNFYNTNDYALGWWNVDQNNKPDIATSPGYHYSSSSGFYKIIGTGTNSTTYLSFPGDTYEIFAYGDPAWSYALGGQPSVGGAFKVGLTYQQVELDIAPYNFDATHKYHSGQFRSDNMSRAVFWNTVLNKMNLLP